MLGPGEVDRLTVGVAFAVDTASEAKAKAAAAAVEEAGDAAAASFKSAFAGAALAAGAAALGLAVSTAKAADELHDLGIRSGMSVEEVQALGYAANRTGTTLEVMATGLTTLQRQIGAARHGSKDAAGAFDALGLDPAKLGKAKDALPAIATALSGVADDAERARLRMLLLGEAGPRMAELLDLGGDGLVALTRQAKAFQGEITTADAELAGDFLDDLNDLELLARRTGYAIGFELIRPMHGLVNVVHDFIGERADDYASRLAYAVGKIPQPVKSAAIAAGGLATAWGAVGVARSMGQAAAAASPLAAGLLGQASAAGLAVRAAGPYALALAAAALVADDLAVAARGGDSEIMRLAKRMGVESEASEAIKSFDGLLSETADTAWELGGALADGIGDALTVLAEKFPEVAPYLQQVADLLHEGVAGLSARASTAAGDALEYIADQNNDAMRGGKAIRSELAEGGLSGLLDSGLLSGPQYVAPGVYSRGGQQYVPTTGENGGTINVPVYINTEGKTRAQIAEEASEQVRQQVLNAKAAMGVD